MVDKNEFPRRIITAETLTRGDAMRAADEWMGQVRHEVASRAFWSQVDIDEERAWPAAQNALATVIELPPDSRYPQEMEKQWRLRVRLYSAAISNDIEESDRLLREDYKRYMKLFYDVLRIWQQKELHERHCSLPFGEFQELAYFGCNECGWDFEELLKRMSELHDKHCAFKKKD